jgi:hypothetical protein
VLEPGGVLALVERAGPLRVVPDGAEVARPGLSDRLDAAWAAWFDEMRSRLPGHAASADYPTMLEESGFEVVVDAELTVELDAPLDDRAGRFAREHLRRARARLADHADPADLEALAHLLDEHVAPGRPGGVPRDVDPPARADLRLVAHRRLYVSRVPLDASASERRP